MEKQITQIMVAQSRVGLVGLIEVFEEVRHSDPSDDESCQEELLRHIQVENYVPEAAVADYKKALWREYRRWKGEQVEPEENTGLVIEVLGPGCYACEKLIEEVREILAKSGVEAELEHVRDPRRIAEYGLLATPVLVVNGEVKCSGKRPPRKEIEVLIARPGC